MGHTTEAEGGCLPNTAVPGLADRGIPYRPLTLTPQQMAEHQLVPACPGRPKKRKQSDRTKLDREAAQARLIVFPA